jgi:hypothetical protein
MVRISGVFDQEQSDRLDRVAEQLAAREPELRAIYDFTDLEQLAVPAERIAERARKPAVVAGMRIIVASRAFAGQKGRSFSATQSNAGERAPMIADSIEQAYVLLGLDHKARFDRFEPDEG